MPEMTEEQRKALEEKIKNMSPEQLAELQKQQCIFCQIISKKIPSKIIHEDEHSLSILDINPAAKGHILILPKIHYAIMPQLPDPLIGHLFIIAQQMSQLQLRSLKVSGTNIFIANGLAAGQRAQHFLIHVIPRKEGDNLLGAEEKLLDKTYQQNIAQAIQGRLNELLGIPNQTPQESLPESLELSSPPPTPSIPAQPEQPLSSPSPLPQTSAQSISPKKIKKPKESSPEESEPSTRPKESVSLDDIANLFK